MFGKIKYVIYGVVGIAVVFSLMNDKSGSDSAGTSMADLDRVLNVASDSMNRFEGTAGVTEDNVMEKFSSSYSDNLNSTQPPLHSGKIGVNSEKDGSFLSFDDTNNNGVKDAGEKDLFKLEVDSENNRLVASREEEVREYGFSGTGLLMGMLIGNMLSRQRATGANPAAKKATPNRARAARAASSAKSRAGSGSHSRGK